MQSVCARGVAWKTEVDNEDGKGHGAWSEDADGDCGEGLGGVTYLSSYGWMDAKRFQRGVDACLCMRIDPDVHGPVIECVVIVTITDVVEAIKKIAAVQPTLNSSQRSLLVSLSLSLSALRVRRFLSMPLSIGCVSCHACPCVWSVWLGFGVHVSCGRNDLAFHQQGVCTDSAGEWTFHYLLVVPGDAFLRLACLHLSFFSRSFCSLLNLAVYKPRERHCGLLSACLDIRR